MSGDQRWNHQLDDFGSGVYFFTGVDCTHWGQFGGWLVFLFLQTVFIFAICSLPYALLVLKTLVFMIHNNFFIFMQNPYLGLRVLYSNRRLDILYCCRCYRLVGAICCYTLLAAHSMDLFELKVLRQSVSACWATACFRLGTEVIDKWYRWARYGQKSPCSIICSTFLFIFVHIYIEKIVSQDATELLLTLLSAHVARGVVICVSLMYRW